MRMAFASLKWRIVRHGPNDERGFGLIAGGLAAVAVIVLASLVNAGSVDASWLTVAVTIFGLTWFLGPILLPGSAPILNPQWFRTLPKPPAAIARALAPTEAMGAGTVVTALALSSIVIVSVPYGFRVTGIAIAAACAQMFFLLWLGKCTAVWVNRLLRSRAGMTLAAFQMSVVLAVSFAGWVPIVALILPAAGDGDTAVVTPSVASAVPDSVENVLLALPTGWAFAAVEAGQTSLVRAILPVVGLLIGGALLRSMWVVLTARTLKEPPARQQSNTRAKARNPVTQSTLSKSSRFNGPIAAVTVRELKTWFRDPQRALELRHAWMTPLLMILLVAPTNWSWALPFIGVMGAVFGAMVAVNTYALDGTALWQLITTPGAIGADIRGRQLAWMLLFGLPALISTIVLCVVSQSPFWAISLGATLAAIGAGCAATPLLSVLMPAFGTDARERISTGQDAGNAAGGQMTVFAVVIAVSVVPGVLAGVTGVASVGAIHLLLGTLSGGAAVLVFSPLTRARLERTGPALLAAMTSGDITTMRTAA